ncbi:MAG TPA: hypothetical protein VIK91_00560 [Nannocystis sp.]
MRSSLLLSSLIAFALAFTLGACTAPERESCENFREARNNCEAANGTYKAVNFDLCNNVDPECKEFYDCAAALECVELNNGRFSLGGLQVDKTGKESIVHYRALCPQPEDKECTDEDLRELIEPAGEE